MSEFLEKIKTYFELSKVAPISRRYFVMNGFDGAMIILGIIIGAYIAETNNPIWIITTGLGASVAMGLSGFYGAYATEEVERIINLNKLEKSMLKKLDKSIIGRAGKFATLWVALVDGLSPFFIAIISLIPFIFSIFGFISVVHAIYFSMGIVLVILFLLGIFMGKMSKKNIIISGIKMLLVGVILTFIFLFFKVVA